jgi:hypothetical protein
MSVALLMAADRPLIRRAGGKDAQLILWLLLLARVPSGSVCPMRPARRGGTARTAPAIISSGALLQICDLQADVCVQDVDVSLGVSP